jgi:hypothetical protein
LPWAHPRNRRVEHSRQRSGDQESRWPGPAGVNPS